MCIRGVSYFFDVYIIQLLKFSHIFFSFFCTCTVILFNTLYTPESPKTVVRLTLSVAFILIRHRANKKYFRLPQSRDFHVLGVATSDM